MAKNGFKVMDSDMHTHEPWDLWLNYIDPAYKDRAPVRHQQRPRRHEHHHRRGHPRRLPLQPETP